jgi:hypothetical protein
LLAIFIAVSGLLAVHQLLHPLPTLVDFLKRPAPHTGPRFNPMDLHDGHEED